MAIRVQKTPCHPSNPCSKNTRKIRVQKPASFPAFQGTISVICTIYVQYLYNICTFTIVQVLYNYCTYIVQRPVLVWSGFGRETA
jgi:hypothetical protein